jgi:hypothetical protein
MQSAHRKQMAFPISCDAPVRLNTSMASTSPAPVAQQAFNLLQLESASQMDDTSIELGVKALLVLLPGL